MLHQLVFAPLYAVLVYNNPEPVAFKVYVEEEPIFTECRLQNNTTYANRRFICLNRENKPVMFEVKKELPITK